MRHDTTKPSGRIRSALDALREWEDAPNREVDMCIYHARGLVDQICYACLGGAAAVYQFDLDPLALEGQRSLEGHPNEETIVAFEDSLDFARMGDIGEMFYRMGLEEDDGEGFNREIANYHDNRDGFFADMRELANDLEEAGY